MPFAHSWNVTQPAASLAGIANSTPFMREIKWTSGKIWRGAKWTGALGLLGALKSLAFGYGAWRESKDTLGSKVDAKINDLAKTPAGKFLDWTGFLRNKNEVAGGKADGASAPKVQDAHPKKEDDHKPDAAHH